MRIVFDHNVPLRLRRHLTGHDVTTARRMGWDTLANGELIAAAAETGFDALLTIDKNIEHEQNLAQLPLPIVMLDAPSNALPMLLSFVGHLLKLLASPLPRCLHIIEPDGHVWVLTDRR